MDHIFDKMIDTLMAARDAVHHEVEALERQFIPDDHRLRQLRKSVRSFSQQTDQLLLLMVERNAPEPPLERVEDLFDVFHAVEDRIDALLASGRGKIKARRRA
jgi:hypothetical protein